MTSNRFTATLLRTSAGGFAAMAVSRTIERSTEPGELGGGFEAWHAHFQTLVLELAAAVDDGSPEQFAAKVGWARDAFTARGLQAEILSAGLEELRNVLEESLASEAWAPLPEFLDAARHELERTSTPGAVAESGDDLFGELADAYLAVIHEGDGPRAIDLVLGAIRDGRLSVPDALERVLPRALRKIGRMWHVDAATVAEEHFTSQTTGRLLEHIMLVAPASPASEPTVMLTMVEGDAHDLGLRIVAAFFELDGWRTICLGANTPTTDLSLAARNFDADLIVIGATLNTQRDAVARAIEALRESRPDQKVLVGGPAFAELAGRPREIGADGFALAPRDAVRLGRQVIGA